MTTREEIMKSTRLEVESDVQKEKRKQIILFIFKLTFIIVLLFSIFYLYTKYISTSRIIVKEKRIVSDKLPNSFNGSKIIQFSDLYYGSTIYIKETNNIVKQINKRKPNLVLFTGNLIDKSYKFNDGEKEKLIESLSNISSTIGKYAILSDEDTDDSKTILKQSGFIFLEDTSELIYNNNNEPILLSFLSNDVNKAFEYYNNENNNKNIFNILLLKNPDDIDKVSKYNIDLALSGKSLNGQICLYSDLCFVKVDGAKKYYKEHYRVNNIDLYISSGLGSPNTNFRFMARPSINFFRLAVK